MGCNTSHDVHQPVSAPPADDKNPVDAEQPVSKEVAEESTRGETVHGQQDPWSEQTDEPGDLVSRASESQMLNTSVSTGLGAHGASLSSRHSTVAFPLHQHRRSSLDVAAVRRVSAGDELMRIDTQRPSNTEHRKSSHRSSSLLLPHGESTAGGRHRAKSFARRSSPRLSIPTMSAPPHRTRSRSLSFSPAGHAVDEASAEMAGRLPRFALETWGRAALLVDGVGATTVLVADSLASSGYICEVAEDSDKALEMAMARSYYLILWDVSIPKEDAIQNTKAIRTHEKLNGQSFAYIFGITNESGCDDASIHEYAAADMDGCIQKGGVLSQAIHEALAMKVGQLNSFAFVPQSISGNALGEDSLREETSLNDVQLELVRTPQDRDLHAIPLSFERKRVTVRSRRQCLLMQVSQRGIRVASRAFLRCGYSLHVTHCHEDLINKAQTLGCELILVDVQESSISDVVGACKELRAPQHRSQIHKGARSLGPPPIVFGLGSGISQESHSALAKAGMNGCFPRGDDGCMHALYEAVAIFRVSPSQYVQMDEQGALVAEPNDDLEHLWAVTSTTTRHSVP